MMTRKAMVALAAGIGIVSSGLWASSAQAVTHEKWSVKSITTEIDRDDSPTVAAAVDAAPLHLDLNNPEEAALFEHLFETDDDLNVVLTLNGSTSTAPGELRRAADELEAAADRPVAPVVCPDLPALMRLDGAQAYLDCDRSTGVIRMGEVHRGETSESLAAAVTEALDLSDDLARGVEVIDKNGRVTVDLPAGALPEQPKADAADVDRRLLLTAFSHRGVESVQFTIEGNCLSYAFATAGDTCAVVPMAHLATLMAG